MYVIYPARFLIILLAVLFISGCKKDNHSPDPEFETLVEELDYLADRYVKMGAVIGIIDRNQQQQEFY